MYICTIIVDVLNVLKIWWSLQNIDRYIQVQWNGLYLPLCFQMSNTNINRTLLFGNSVGFSLDGTLSRLLSTQFQ